MQDLNQFLASVEKRAFRMAQIATGNSEDALDIVQDSMMKLVQAYGHKDTAELSPLFYRILQNRITDWHRRGTLTQRLFRWWRHGGSETHDDSAVDPWEKVAGGESPHQQLEQERQQARLIQVLQQLPQRQQQAFLLRSWEGFDVKQTAEIMGCSEGSVKTHYFRAMNQLKQHLDD